MLAYRVTSLLLLCIACIPSTYSFSLPMGLQVHSMNKAVVSKATMRKQQDASKSVVVNAGLVSRSEAATEKAKIKVKRGIKMPLEDEKLQELKDSGM